MPSFRMIVLAGLVLLPGAAQAGCAAAWKASAVYTQGDEVSEAGVNYTANYWTQGQNPETGSGAAGDPWSVAGICAPCSARPTVPGGLAAVATSDTRTDLIWRPSRVPLNCRIGGYTVFQDGTAVGQASGSSLAIAGLGASTLYRFSVAAEDQAGRSAPSAALAVTTAAAGQGRGPAPLFAPYIDMSQTESERLLSIAAQSGTRHFTLAFVLSPGGACAAAWGGVGTIAQDRMPDGTSILSLVKGLRARGGDVAVSFGGAAGEEPALACGTAAALQAVYQQVVARYGLTLLDFDIEGAAVLDRASLARRDQALAGLRKADPGLVISYTLPVLPSGLDANGVALLARAKADGFAPDIVNVMTMDYGAEFDDGSSMAARAIAAANATALQIRAAGLAARVGITPMIGVNDDNAELFTLADAAALVAFARPTPDVARIAMWSVNRDNGGCAGARYASPTCSGLAQGAYAFMKAFGSF